MSKIGNIKLIHDALKKKYKDYNHCNKSNPLNELVYILLSVQTSERSYQKSYLAFKRYFPKHIDILNADENDIQDVIRHSGLSGQRAAAIKQSLSIINSRFNKPSLAPLNKLNDKEVEEFLVSLPRVGTKVARCIMMYSLDRKVFPVDTHVWRISRRIGWVRRTRKDFECRKKDMDRLQNKIPPNLMHSLHVNMVSLGKEICTARSPQCYLCPIENYCRKIGAQNNR